MIHRVEIAKDIVFCCGDRFLEEFNKLVKKELNKYRYDKT